MLHKFNQFSFTCSHEAATRQPRCQDVTFFLNFKHILCCASVSLVEDNQLVIYVHLVVFMVTNYKICEVFDTN